MATSSNNIYPGSKVKVLDKVFTEVFPHNVWEVSHVDTAIHKDSKTMYVCLPIKEDGTKGTTAFQFTKDNLELIS